MTAPHPDPFISPAVEAFAGGVAAGLLGLSRRDNPYPGDAALAAIWLEGWLSASGRRATCVSYAIN